MARRGKTKKVREALGLLGMVNANPLNLLSSDRDFSDIGLLRRLYHVYPNSIWRFVADPQAFRTGKFLRVGSEYLAGSTLADTRTLNEVRGLLVESLQFINSDSRIGASTILISAAIARAQHNGDLDKLLPHLGLPTAHELYGLLDNLSLRRKAYIAIASVPINILVKSSALLLILSRCVTLPSGRMLDPMPQGILVKGGEMLSFLRATLDVWQTLSPTGQALSATFVSFSAPENEFIEEVGIKIKHDPAYAQSLFEDFRVPYYGWTPLSRGLAAKNCCNVLELQLGDKRCAHLPLVEKAMKSHIRVLHQRYRHDDDFKSKA